MTCIQCSQCGGNLECDEQHCHEGCVHVSLKWATDENKELRDQLRLKELQVEDLKKDAARAEKAFDAVQSCCCCVCGKVKEATKLLGGTE